MTGKFEADWEITVKVRLKNALVHNEPEAERALRELIDDEGGLMNVICGWCDPEDLTLLTVIPVECSLPNYRRRRRDKPAKCSV